MSKEYVTRCIVKKDGKEYKKGSVMAGLTDEEIKQGLKNHWLESVGHDDEPDNGSPKEKPMDQMNKAELTAKAAELGIPLEEGMSKADMQKTIMEAMKA